MARPLSLSLSEEQRCELLWARDHHAKPYIRERAAALLKVADGQSARAVALGGLLQPRKPDTLYAWSRRYQREGFSGLLIRSGRGRKAAYAPRYADLGTARAALLDVVRRDPSCLGHPQSRWTLKAIRDTCPWLMLSTDSGLSRLLHRLAISYKRGRSYIHSPDPDYVEKLSYIAQCLLRAWYAPADYVLLYQDECHYNRQPTLSYDYEARGHDQPRARLSYQGNTRFWVVGSLDAITGRVLFRQHSKVGVRQLVQFHQLVREAYPQAKTIYLVQDNWPVHFHPEVLAKLDEQAWPWPFRMPKRWQNKPPPPKASETLPIQLLCLPTYASWLNPIEKLWRYLKQQVVHLHRLSDAWSELKEHVANFFEWFAEGSEGLLRYVGLLPG